MTEEQKKIVSDYVAEWLEYARKNFDWGNEMMDFLEDILESVCTHACLKVIKNVQDENERLKKAIKETEDVEKA